MGRGRLRVAEARGGRERRYEDRVLSDDEDGNECHKRMILESTISHTRNTTLAPNHVSGDETSGPYLMIGLICISLQSDCIR